MQCDYCVHVDVCKLKDEYEYLNRLYRSAMASYRPDYGKPKLSDISYIKIPDLECRNYEIDVYGFKRRSER